MNEIEICTLNGVKWLLGDEAPERMNWKDAKDWCESIGQELPTREVLLMAYMNPETCGSFAVDYCYWSSTELDSTYVWLQAFINGTQGNYNKDYTLRVRAVRAIKVEGLTPREGLTEYKKGYARAELDLKREPLSGEAIAELWTNKSPMNEFECTRIVEKAHGIGGEE